MDPFGKSIAVHYSGDINSDSLSAYEHHPTESCKKEDNEYLFLKDNEDKSAHKSHIICEENEVENDNVITEHKSAESIEKSSNHHVLTEEGEPGNEFVANEQTYFQGTENFNEYLSYKHVSTQEEEFQSEQVANNQESIYLREQEAKDIEETGIQRDEHFQSTQENEPIDDVKFENQCELCELGYNGTATDHLNTLFDNLIGPERFQQMYRAMQKHWSDFNMRNVWVQPFCKVCNVHFQGFLKMSAHLGEKSRQCDDEIDKIAHLALLDKYRAFIHGIRDDGVTRSDQEELLKLLTCDHGPCNFHKLHLKDGDVNNKFVNKKDNDDTCHVAEEKEDVSKQEDDSNTCLVTKDKDSIDQCNSESDAVCIPNECQEAQSTNCNSSVRRHENYQQQQQQPPLFRCLMCQRDFRYLRAHIFETFWNVALAENDNSNNGFNHHMQGLLGNTLFNNLMFGGASTTADTTKHPTPYCPCCGVHFCTSNRKGFAKGLIYHLRSKGYAWQKSCAERDDHRAKCDEITNQIMNYLDKSMSVEELVTYFENNFFCRLGGTDFDLGSCCDATRKDFLPSHRNATKRRISDASGISGSSGPRRAYFNKMAHVFPPGTTPPSSVFVGRNMGPMSGPMHAAARPPPPITNIMIQCSLCCSQFNGCNNLHAHLMETLFAARIGRGGQAFPTHRYWHQLLPNGLQVSCPLCFTVCDNLDALAFHVATMMTNNRQHYELACQIADKFVSHMNGYLTMEDMSAFMDNMVRGGSSGRGRGAASYGYWGGNYEGRRGSYRGGRR